MKIIQLSDLHIFADEASTRYGIKNNQQFRKVLRKVIEEDVLDADYIFLTGDLSQDETLEAYQMVLQELSPLKLPVYWINGNHDKVAYLEAVFSQNKQFKRVPKLETADWDFIFLNSKLEGSEAGLLAQAELTLLEQELQASDPSKKVAVVMHHPPLEVGTPLVDASFLQNASDFWKILSDSQAKLVICGHVHGAYTVAHQGITVEAAPATCMQWQRGAKDLDLDARIGYKVYSFDQAGYQAVVKLW